MFDYEKIPDWWALCPNRDCEMAATCLRHQVCMQVPQKYKLWTCVLPNAIEDGKCRFYQKAKKVTMAQGIAAVYKNVQSREARSQIRYALTAHLGSKGTYYRYKNGERMINPQMQQEIIDIVHRYAPGRRLTIMTLQRTINEPARRGRFVPAPGTHCPTPWDKQSHPLGQILNQ